MDVAEWEMLIKQTLREFLRSLSERIAARRLSRAGPPLRSRDPVPTPRVDRRIDSSPSED